MNIEVEIKAILQNPQGVRKQLRQLGGIYASTKKTRDTYYREKEEQSNHYQQDWHLRIRVYDNANSGRLEYHLPLGQLHAEEYECEIGDVEIMDQILEHLGYTKTLIVDKTRETWNVQGFTVVLDHVENAGDFIEVELMNVDVTQGKEKIETFLHTLGIPNEDFRPDVHYYQLVPLLSA